MEGYIRQVDSTLNNVLNSVYKTTVIRGVIHLVLVLYAAKLAPSLPREILAYFENAYVKLFVFSLVLWTAQFSPTTSLLISLAFMVTLNYANKRPLWEFLENVENGDPTQAPTAPTKDVAIDSAAAIVQAQSENTPIVDGVAQKDNTVVIQPTIVQTPNGQAVVNPSVVIAPAIVSNADGEKIIVKPTVTVLEAPQAQAPEIVQAPASPSLVDMTPAPSPAPAPTPAMSKQQTSEPAGCYPVRRYDMSQINAYDNLAGSSFGSVSA